MGGKGEIEAAVRHHHHQQHHNAPRFNPADSATDDVKIQRLVKKVIETTRCSQTDAEAALFDHNNDVEAAVNFIMDRPDHQSDWTEQKSRKTRKEELEEQRERDRVREQRDRAAAARAAGRGAAGGRGGAAAGDARRGAATTNSGSAPAGTNGFKGRGGATANGGEKPERGQGGSGRGGRGAGRGGFAGGRGGSHADGKRSGGGFGQATTTHEETVSDWVSGGATAAVDVDDLVDLQKTGPLVFSNSGGGTVSSAPPPPAASSSTSVTTNNAPATGAGPISYSAAAAAALTKERQAKEEAARRQAVAAAAAHRLDRTTSAVASTPQQQQSINASAFRGDASPSTAVEASPRTSLDEDARVTRSPNAAAPSASKIYANTNDVWTQQLKNELGIGAPSVTQKPPAPPSAAATPESTSSAGQASTQHSQAPSSSKMHPVEFVTTAGSTSLGDYQFGFDAPSTMETSVQVQQASAQDATSVLFAQAAAHQSAASAPVSRSPAPVVPPQQVASSAPVPPSVVPTSVSVAPVKLPDAVDPRVGGGLPNGGDFATSLKTSSPPHYSSSSRGLGYEQSSTVSYSPMERNLQQQQPKPVQAPQQPPPQAPTQQQPPVPTFPNVNPSGIPYGGYPFPMYSPVTGMRGDDYATALQYPFFGVGGMGHFDLSSLNSILPGAGTGAGAPGLGTTRADSHQAAYDPLKNYGAQLLNGGGGATSLTSSASGTISGGASGLGTGTTPGQRAGAPDPTSIPPPPGFAANMFPPQNLASIFPGMSQMSPFAQTHYPNYMIGNNGHAQQTRPMYQPQVDDQNDARGLGQKTGGYGSSMDKFGGQSLAKDRGLGGVGGGATQTPPQHYQQQNQGFQGQQHNGYNMGQMKPKSYGAQNWNN